MSEHRTARRALIVVDCQNDFCENGSLAVEGGAATVADIAAFIGSLEDDVAVVATLDSHVDPGAHFSDNPDFVDSWPAHCVVGMPGAQPHANLLTVLGRIDGWFAKGAHEAAYSGFEGRSTTSDEMLGDYLRRRRISAVDVVGIATDYCVAATVRSAVAEGFNVRLLSNLCAAVRPDSVPALCEELRDLGVEISVS